MEIHNTPPKDHAQAAIYHSRKATEYANEATKYATKARNWLLVSFIFQVIALVCILINAMS